MPRLILLRHAKADTPEGGKDRERPLAEAGREAARRVGQRLADLALHPDLALVSPARRTRETWDLVAEALGETAVRVEDELYATTAEGLLEVLREIEPEVGTVLVVGHNPGIEDLARLLVGVTDPTSGAQMMQTFPAAAFAVLDFPVAGWREIEPRSGRLERFVGPGREGG